MFKRKRSRIALAFLALIALIALIVLLVTGGGAAGFLHLGGSQGVAKPTPPPCKYYNLGSIALTDRMGTDPVLANTQMGELTLERSSCRRSLRLTIKNTLHDTPVFVVRLCIISTKTISDLKDCPLPKGFPDHGPQIAPGASTSIEVAYTPGTEYQGIGSVNVRGRYPDPNLLQTVASAGEQLDITP